MMPALRHARALAACALLAISIPQARAQFGGEPLGEGPWDVATELGTVHVSVLADGLESPWSLVFLPNGDMLLAERTGRLRVLRGGELDPDPIEGLPDMAIVGISGLFGLALHPEFESNRLVYFAYPKQRPGDPEALSLAVSRARWDGGDALSNVEELFVAKDWYSPAMAAENDRCCGQGPATGSFGARLTFDDEGMLYVSSGDRNWGERSQDPQSHLGKILRLNDDGSVPDDNPFVGDDDYLPEIYTLGHRNQTGMRFDSETGVLWSTEFGPAGGDELNRIEAGGNYGWLLVTNGMHYDRTGGELGTDGVDGFIDPVTWWPNGGNPGNLDVYHGDLFPGWEDNVFIATMSGRRMSPGLVRIVIDAHGNAVHEERMLTELGTRMRDVVAGPDGKLYVLTETGPFASPGVVLVLEPGAGFVQD